MRENQEFASMGAVHVTKWRSGGVVDNFRSPMEITTLFLVLSIGFYVYLFWRSQIQATVQPNRRKDSTRKPHIHPRRRTSDRHPVEDMVVNQLFEDEDADTDKTATDH